MRNESRIDESRLVYHATVVAAPGAMLFGYDIGA
jgi:hypothetical protein